MIKKLNKKGSHVGLVLSFMIFAIFLVFLNLIISPSINVRESNQDLLKVINQNVLEALSNEIWVLRVNDPNTCLEIDPPISGGDVVAYNEAGIVDSEVSAGSILVEGGGFTKIYYSDIIQGESPGLSGCSSVTVNSTIKEEKILENKIIELINNVSEDYDGLKIALDIPSNIEFDISFEYINGTLIGGQSREQNIEIYSKETQIYFLSSNADNEKGILRVRIW